MIQKLYLPSLPGLNQMLDAARISRKIRSGRKIFRIAKHDDDKKKIEAGIVAAIKTQDITPVDAAHLVYIHIEKNRRRDPSNVRAGAEKYVWDALQAAGILVNDGWKQDLGTEHEFYVNPVDPCLIVIIISGEDAPERFSAAKTYLLPHEFAGNPVKRSRRGPKRKKK